MLDPGLTRSERSVGAAASIACLWGKWEPSPGLQLLARQLDTIRAEGRPLKKALVPCLLQDPVFPAVSVVTVDPKAFLYYPCHGTDGANFF